MENLKRIFGMLEDSVRIYQIYEQNEVDREEFTYCQLMHQIVFGEKGFAETLGPTWGLVSDPRFMLIEGMMIVDRHGIFGGDARLGKQYISDDVSTAVSDLEKYAEILGEGRNFHNVLVHPHPDCQIRKWLERIQTGHTSVKPHLSLKCYCKEEEKLDPVTFKDQPDEVIWHYILQECPNRGFTKFGAATAYGILMFNLIKADLVGLIHDYAETPLIDSYIYLHDNDVVVSAEKVHELDPNGLDHQRVLQEIDILEQALTHRATLRVTAAKILHSLGFEKHLETLQGNLQLTDLERDELLRIVYESEWPENKTLLLSQLMDFINTRTQRPFTEREHRHLQMAKASSQETIRGLLNGTIRPINHYTEPVMEIPQDVAESEVMQYGAILDSLTKNPLKADLFAVYVAAEQEAEIGVLDLLSPIFDPHYELTEEAYFNFLRAVTHRVRSLRAVESVVPRGTEDAGITPKKNVQLFTEEFHSKDSPYRVSE